MAALAAVSGDTLLILGGSDKGECFDELFEKMPGSVKRILVTGANGDKIIEAALRAGRFDVSYRATLKECVTESLSFSGENVVFRRVRQVLTNFPTTLTEETPSTNTFRSCPMRKINLKIPVLAVVLSVFGVVMIYSASSYSAQRTYGDAFFTSKSRFLH